MKALAPLPIILIAIAVAIVIASLVIYSVNNNYKTLANSGINTTNSSALNTTNSTFNYTQSYNGTINESLDSNTSVSVVCNTFAQLPVGSGLQCGAFTVVLGSVAIGPNITNSSAFNTTDINSSVNTTTSIVNASSNNASLNTTLYADIDIYYNDNLTNSTIIPVNSFENFTVNGQVLNMSIGSIGNYSNSTLQWADIELGVSQATLYLYCVGDEDNIPISEDIVNYTYLGFGNSTLTNSTSNSTSINNSTNSTSLNSTVNQTVIINSTNSTNAVFYAQILNNANQNTNSINVITSPMSACASYPSDIAYCVPITISNNQMLATPTPFQQMVVVNEITYGAYLGPNLQNVEFYYPNGRIIPSWLEDNGSTSSNATYWLKLTQTIPENANAIIYMGFASNSVNLFDGINVGEAPQLSNSYGEYDNGADVFSDYCGFVGSSLCIDWSGNIGAGAVTVNNGLVLGGYSGSSGLSSPGLIQNYNIPTAPYVVESYVNPYDNGACTEYETTIYSSNYGGASEFQEFLDLKRGCSESGYYATFIGFEGGILSSGGPYQAYDDGNSFDVASATVLGPNSNQFSAQLNYNGPISAIPGNYVLEPNSISIYSLGASIIQWARTRTYPPNGIMPNANFGKVYKNSSLIIQTTLPVQSYITSNGIGNWIQTLSYPVALNHAGCNIYNDSIYCFGTHSTLDENESYYSPLSSTGIVGWNATVSYPIALTDAGCSVYNGYEYCIGTSQPVPPYITNVTTGYINQTFFGQINDSLGTITNWTNTTSYPIPFAFSGCSIFNGYIYCVGSPGIGYGKETYFAPVNASGIGNWIQTTPYPDNFVLGSCSTSQGYIYCIGGALSNDTSSYFAPISNNGIGNWIKTTTYPGGELFDAGCNPIDDYIYCIGNEYNDTRYDNYANVILIVNQGACKASANISVGGQISCGGFSAALNYISVHRQNVQGKNSEGANVIIKKVEDVNLSIYEDNALVGTTDLVQTSNGTIKPGVLDVQGQNVTVSFDSTSGGSVNSTQATFFAPISSNGIGVWQETAPYPVPFYGAYCTVAGSSGGYLNGGGDSGYTSQLSTLPTTSTSSTITIPVSSTSSTTILSTTSSTSSTSSTSTTIPVVSTSSSTSVSTTSSTSTSTTSSTTIPVGPTSSTTSTTSSTSSTTSSSTTIPVASTSSTTSTTSSTSTTTTIPQTPLQIISISVDECQTYSCVPLNFYATVTWGGGTQPYSIDFYSSSTKDGCGSSSKLLGSYSNLYSGGAGYDSFSYDLGFFGIGNRGAVAGYVCAQVYDSSGDVVGTEAIPYYNYPGL